MILGRHWAVLALALATAVLAVGCEDETTQPEDDSLVLPEPNTPEALISGIELIYNDRTHGADERLAAYASLFDSTFTFHFQPADIAHGLPPKWGLEDELQANGNIFSAQSAGDIESLELRVTHNTAQDLTPPEVGREGWKEVFATSVFLRLMFNAHDGIEVNGAQASFLFSPTTGNHYSIADWADLPRPLGRAQAVDPPTWGKIKANFHRGPGKSP